MPGARGSRSLCVCVCVLMFSHSHPCTNSWFPLWRPGGSAPWSTSLLSLFCCTRFSSPEDMDVLKLKWKVCWSLTSSPISRPIFPISWFFRVLSLGSLSAPGYPKLLCQEQSQLCLGETVIYFNELGVFKDFVPWSNRVQAVPRQNK